MQIRFCNQYKNKIKTITKSIKYKNKKKLILLDIVYNNKNKKNLK